MADENFSFTQFFMSHLWLAKVLGALSFTFFLSLLERRIFFRVYPKLQGSKRFWDDAVLYALHLPVYLYIWLMGITFCITILGKGFKDDPYILSTIEMVQTVGGYVLFIWGLSRFTKLLEKNFNSPRKLGKHDPTTVGGIIQALKIFVFIVAGLAALQFLGIPLSGVIAFGGIGGVVVGFAAKDLLANFFGGFMIFLDRPFQIGDWIRSPDKEIEGTVEHIGWRLTRIRTFDKRPLFVPNSLFSTISLENPSRMSNRRIKTTFGLRYEDASRVATVLNEIETMLKTHPEIDSSKVCFVKLVNFGPYSLEVEVYAFTKTTDWIKFQSVQQGVFLKILEIISQNQSQCAYPVTSLHLSSLKKTEEIFSYLNKS